MWWFITGLVIGVCSLLLVSWTRRAGLQVKWYTWLVAALGVVLILLALQNYYAFRREMDPYAANVMLALLGVPGLALAAVAAVAAWFGNRAKAPARAAAPAKATAAKA